MGMCLEYLLDNSQVKCFRHDKMGMRAKLGMGGNTMSAALLLVWECPGFHPEELKEVGKF